jgi:hypothetical protein
MNRWYVFEWIKQRYLKTGTVPPIEAICTQFPKLEQEEIDEGIAEFEAMAVKGKVSSR